MEGYCALHVHSHMDSVLDSMVRVTREGKNKPCLLQEKAKEYNIPAIALTGHGNMSGIISHYKTCQEYGTKCIVGLETYVTDDLTVKDTTSKYYHLILLAKNDIGYRNLKVLSSIGYLDGFYRKPRIDFKTLSEYSEGLICCTACLAGELPRMIMQYHRYPSYQLEQQIDGWITAYKILFGDDFYFEIQSSDSEEQVIVNKELVKLSKEYSIPIVVTTDVHFLNKEGFDAHNVYININQDRDTENYKYCYLQSRQEIESILSYLPSNVVQQALDNTYAVADKCNVEIELGHPYLPHLKVPDEYTNEYDWLVSEVKKGLKSRGILSKPNRTQYIDRIKVELEVIKAKDFVGYFLILMQILRKAKERGIPIGEGRGSAGGCLVAYCIGITNVDSVEYDLDFGRFLTMERKDLCDIDTDVSTSRRQELIDIMVEMFGKDNVAQIATFGTLTSKAVLDAVGKVMGIDRATCDGFKAKITDSEGVKSIEHNDPKTYNQYKEYFDICSKVEGSNRSYGCHAGGVCISGNNKPMVDYAPVMYNKDGNIMTQFEMHDVESVGLVKYDMLGLTSLDYIADTLELIGSDYYSYEFDYNDQDVFDMISRGDNTGVFQADSNFAYRVLTSVKPHSINELADCVSIGRPDAIQFLQPYVDAKFSGKQVEEIHPDLTKILSRTYGCLIYQEQMMGIFKVFGGFTDGEADKVRKIIGKKQLDALPEQLDKFKSGAIQRGYTQDVIDKLVDFINHNISYSFNMAHAVAYAITTYKTAYLKYHYPVEFMTAIINNQKTENGATDFDSVKAYIKSAKDMGITVKGTDINLSDSKFVPDSEHNTILFGFGLVKGLTNHGIDIIIANRPFSSYKDFINRIGLELSKSDVIALIKSGSFDSISDSDKINLFKYYYLIRFNAKKEDYKPIGKVNKTHIKKLLDGGYITPEQAENKEYCTELLNKTRKSEGWKEFKDKYCSGTELDWEMETLNAYLSGNPFDGVRLPDWHKVSKESIGYVGGIIVDVKEVVIKNGKNKGKKMCFLNVAQGSEVVDIVVFNKQYLDYKDLFKVGKPVVCTVKKEGDLNGSLSKCYTLNEYLEMSASIQGKV